MGSLGITVSAAAAFAALANSVRSNPMGCSSVDVPGEMGTRLINLCIGSDVHVSASYVLICLHRGRGIGVFHRHGGTDKDLSLGAKISLWVDCVDLRECFRAKTKITTTYVKRLGLLIKKLTYI